MNLPDPTPLNPVTPGPEPSMKSMRNLLHAIAISVLILAGTLFIFIYRQVVLIRRQTAEMVTFLMNYERSSERELIGQLHQRFADFTRQNPDFTPIYTRYFGTNEPPRRAVSTNATGPTSPSKVVPAPSAPPGR